MTPNHPILPDAGARGSAIGDSFGDNMARHGWARKFINDPCTSSFTLRQGRMVIAAVGHGATQAPQPVHVSKLTSGSGWRAHRRNRRRPGIRYRAAAGRLRRPAPCSARLAGLRGGPAPTAGRRQRKRRRRCIHPGRNRLSENRHRQAPGFSPDRRSGNRRSGCSGR
jgi:hypothetical protein